MNAAIPERRPATEEISGLIERVTFRNDDSGFCRGMAERGGLVGRFAAFRNRATLLRLPGVRI